MLAQEFKRQTSDRPIADVSELNLHLESTLQELPLYDCQIETSCPGKALDRAFEANPLLPGIILTREGELAGMISRRRFLEFLSRPYGLELFFKRPVHSLYRFAQTELLVFPSHTPIVAAARQSLQRPLELLYEPILVEIAPQVYRLADVHQLLVAQSQIHQLTTTLLEEQTKAQMMQTEKMSSLGRMVAGIAHEIKNPVNCIGGNVSFLNNYFQDLMELIEGYEGALSDRAESVEALKEDIDFDFLQEDLPQVIKTLEVSAESLTAIVSSLRNFSHMDEAHRKSADIHGCIESTLLILKNRLKYGVEVVKDYGDLPEVRCYSGQLSQVFMNLIGNAIDALEMEREERPDLDKTPTVTLRSRVIDDEWISIAVADNGPGIPPEIQGRIFEDFFTTKPVGKGTGMGLAISYQIVTEKHGGQFELRSRVGEGTEFEIRLPQN